MGCPLGRGRMCLLFVLTWLLKFAWGYVTQRGMAAFDVVYLVEEASQLPLRVPEIGVPHEVNFLLLDGAHHPYPFGVAVLAWLSDQGYAVLDPGLLEAGMEGSSLDKSLITFPQWVF
jgi:hypothetical protein